MIYDVETLCPAVYRCSERWADNDGGVWCYGCEILDSKTKLSERLLKVANENRMRIF